MAGHLSPSGLGRLGEDSIFIGRPWGPGWEEPAGLWKGSALLWNQEKLHGNGIKGRASQTPQIKTESSHLNLMQFLGQILSLEFSFPVGSSKEVLLAPRGRQVDEDGNFPEPE